MAHGVSIIIPTFNERENIAILIPRICRILEGKVEYEIIVVDDNSPDGTWKEAIELSREYRNIRVRRRINKRGLASAILEGIAMAKYSSVIVMDADLQHPPEVIPSIIRGLKNADIVIASRYIRGGGIAGWSYIRKLIYLGATMLARFLFPKIHRVKDPMSGFFGVRKDILRGIKLNAIGFKILFDILVKARYKRVLEVPYVFRTRVYGESKLSSKTMGEFLKHVVVLLIQTNGMVWISVLLAVLFIIAIIMSVPL